ncbi:unnamed protein product, partial [Iphiclides podalirius]
MCGGRGRGVVHPAVEPPLGLGRRPASALPQCPTRGHGDDVTSGIEARGDIQATRAQILRKRSAADRYDGVNMAVVMATRREISSLPPPWRPHQTALPELPCNGVGHPAPVTLTVGDGTDGAKTRAA